MPDVSFSIDASGAQRGADDFDRAVDQIQTGADRLIAKLTELDTKFRAVRDAAGTTKGIGASQGTFANQTQQIQQLQTELAKLQGTQQKTIQAQQAGSRSIADQTKEYERGRQALIQFLSTQGGENRALAQRVRGYDRLAKAFKEGITPAKLLAEAEKELARSIKQGGANAKEAAALVDLLKKNTTKAAVESRDLRRNLAGMNAAMAELARQSTLVLGPLSGVTARLVAIKQLLASGFAITLGVGAIVGLTTAFVASTRALIGFEQGLADVQALTGAAGADLEFLERQANALSQRFGILGKDVLAAFVAIGSARPELLKNVEALNEVTEAALLLSKATGQGAKESGELIAQVLNQFRLASEEATRVINVIAEGTRLGAITQIEKVGVGFAKAATAARVAGIDLEEFTAILQTLGQLGLPVERVATQLRNIFITLTTGGKQTNPQIVGLRDAIQNLGPLIQNTSRFTKQFGNENIIVAQALIDNIDAITTLTGELTGTNAAYEQAILRTNTLEEDLSRLSASWDLFLRTIGNTTPAREAAQSITTLLNTVSDLLSNFGDLSDVGFGNVLERALADPINNALDSIQARLERFRDEATNPLVRWIGDSVSQIGALVGGVFESALEPQTNLSSILGRSWQDTLDLLERYKREVENLEEIGGPFSAVAIGLRTAAIEELEQAIKRIPSGEEGLRNQEEVVRKYRDQTAAAQSLTRELTVQQKLVIDSVRTGRISLDQGLEQIRLRTSASKQQEKNLAELAIQYAFELRILDLVRERLAIEQRASQVTAPGGVQEVLGIDSIEISEISRAIESTSEQLNALATGGLEALRAVDARTQAAGIIDQLIYGGPPEQKQARLRGAVDQIKDIYRSLGQDVPTLDLTFTGSPEDVDKITEAFVRLLEIQGANEAAILRLKRAFSSQAGEEGTTIFGRQQDILAQQLRLQSVPENERARVKIIQDLRTEAKRTAGANEDLLEQYEREIQVVNVLYQILGRVNERRKKEKESEKFEERISSLRLENQLRASGSENVERELEISKLRAQQAAGLIGITEEQIDRYEQQRIIAEKINEERKKTVEQEKFLSRLGESISQAEADLSLAGVPREDRQRLATIERLRIQGETLLAGEEKKLAVFREQLEQLNAILLVTQLISDATKIEEEREAFDRRIRWQKEENSIKSQNLANEETILTIRKLQFDIEEGISNILPGQVVALQQELEVSDKIAAARLRTAEAQKEAQRASEQLAQDIAKPFENASRAIQSSISGAIKDALVDGISSFDDFKEKAIDIVATMAAEIATLLIFKPQLLQQGGGAGGLLGILTGNVVPGAAGAAASARQRQSEVQFATRLDDLVEVTDKYGSLGTIQADEQQRLQEILNGETRKQTGILGSLPGLIGSAVAGAVVGTGIGGIFGTPTGGGIGGAIGGLVGNIYGPVGQVVGSVIGSVLGSAVEFLTRPDAFDVGSGNLPISVGIIGGAIGGLVTALSTTVFVAIETLFSGIVTTIAATALGAKIGSVVPVIGTIIGAVIGALVGWLIDVFSAPPTPTLFGISTVASEGAIPGGNVRTTVGETFGRWSRETALGFVSIFTQRFDRGVIPKMLDFIETADEAIVSVLTDAELELARQAVRGSDFIHEVTRDPRNDVFGAFLQRYRAILAAVGAQVDEFLPSQVFGLDPIGEGLKKFIEERTDFFAVVQSLRREELPQLVADLSELAKDFNEASEEARRLGVDIEFVTKAYNTGIRNIRERFERDIRLQILDFQDPFQKSLEEISNNAELMVIAAIAAGADLVEVEKLVALQRAKAFEDAFAERVAPITDFLDELFESTIIGTGGTEALKFREQKFNDILTQVRAGEATANELVDAAQKLLETSRDFFGSTAQYFERQTFVQQTLANVASELTAQLGVIPEFQPTAPVAPITFDPNATPIPVEIPAATPVPVALEPSLFAPLATAELQQEIGRATVDNTVILKSAIESMTAIIAGMREEIRQLREELERSNTSRAA